MQFCGNAHGAASAMVALWTGQRFSFEGWATETWQGFSRGFGGDGDGRVASSYVVRFCGNGRQCAPCSTGNVHLVDGTGPLIWRLGDRKVAGRFWGMWLGGLRPAAWHNSTAMGSDACSTAPETPPVDGTTPLVWRLGDRKTTRRFKGCGALLTISKQSGHMLLHQFSHKGP